MHNFTYNIQINFKRKMKYIHIVLSVTSYRQHILPVTMKWLKVEAIKIIFADIKFYSVKNSISSIHIQITFYSLYLFLKKQIQKMMHENEQVPDIEKLEQQEFNLDIEEQERAQAEAEQEVARVW